MTESSSCPESVFAVQPSRIVLFCCRVGNLAARDPRRPDHVTPHPPAMNPESSSEQREHDLTMHVFAVSAAMVGVCLTAIGILRLVAAQTQAQTVGDELLAIDAVLFVVCTSLAFWSFKTHRPTARRRLRVVVDALFLLGLAGMASICALIAYALV